MAGKVVLQILTVLLLLSHGSAAGAVPPVMTPAPGEEGSQEIMKFTDRAIAPASITLERRDSSVFFVNASSDALITLEILFAPHHAHCASSNMHFENGVMRSNGPIGPRDFAVVCFPEAGTYAVKVYGQGGVAAQNATVVVK